jgi:hypothetical protein
MPADFLATFVASRGFNPPHYRRDNDYVEETYCDSIGGPRIRVCFGYALERGHRGGGAIPRSCADLQLRAAPAGLLRSSGVWRRRLSGLWLWFSRAAVPGFRCAPIPRATGSLAWSSLAVTRSAGRPVRPTKSCGSRVLSPEAWAERFTSSHQTSKSNIPGSPQFQHRQLTFPKF